MPKILPFDFGSETSFMGDTITAQCTVTSGDMPILFKWYVNAQQLPEDFGINVGSFGKKTSVLGIETISEKHAGNYTCVAQNSAGSSSYSAELIVKGFFILFKK